MTLRFCEECEGLLFVKEDKGVSYFECSSCGHIQIFGGNDYVCSKETMTPRKIKGDGANEDKNDFADYHHVCRKCGYEFAQILDLGVFISDEDNLILLRCGKCGFSERIGRKTS